MRVGGGLVILALAVSRVHTFSPPAHAYLKQTVSSLLCLLSQGAGLRRLSLPHFLSFDGSPLQLLLIGWKGAAQQWPPSHSRGCFLSLCMEPVSGCRKRGSSCKHNSSAGGCPVGAVHPAWSKVGCVQVPQSRCADSARLVLVSGNTPAAGGAHGAPDWVQVERGGPRHCHMVLLNLGSFTPRLHKAAQH